MNLKTAGINMRHAIKTVDLFPDPQQVYKDSEKQLEKNVKEQNDGEGRKRAKVREKTLKSKENKLWI